ncbi:MAG TPA: LysR family transcriptional regulator [Pyrinomonadaceae bacterium]|jgi:DNA-binding transcriptional LysR family regulator|nr:LysR family transcriptional regulator [Pyrinomonadaceae bacterium]
MEIRQLRAFAAIAETHTFTAAGARVHVTQAAISMQIRQLEKEVGSPLFIRTPRRVVLTDAGERLLLRARVILREHDAALSELAELAGAEHGRLRVGSASAMVSSLRLPRILKELSEQHPQGEISVVSGTSETLVKQILSGELDVAFISLPVEVRGIETELLSRDELIAIASPRHPLAQQRVVSAFTLAGEKLILGERGGNTRRMIDEFFAEAGLKPNVAMELSRQAAIRRMVEAGMGVGIVPRQSAREEIDAGRLVEWWIEGVSINWELGLARLNGGYDSPIRQTFTRLCRQHFDADAATSDAKPAPRTPRARSTKRRPAKRR